MKSKIIAAMFGVLLALSFGVIAQQGGFPSRPRFTAVTVGPGTVATTNQVRVNKAGTSTDSSAIVASSRPVLSFFETDAAADNALWTFDYNAEQFDMRVCTDAGACNSALAISRTGSTIDGATFTATLATFSNNVGVTGALSDPVGVTLDVADNLEASGSVTSTSSGYPSVRSLAAIPVIGIDETDAAANNRIWYMYANGEEFRIAVNNDALGSETPFITANRTGTTVDSVNIAGTVVQANGRTITTGNTANSSVLTAFSSTVTSRTSDATNTCDANLTLSLPNVTARYAFEAFLNFDGNGITANGWSIFPQASTGTVVVNWDASSTTNTTTANAAMVSNTGASGGDMDAVFNAAGVATYVNVKGDVSVTTGAAPAVCIAWGQTASNATASDLNIGSWMRLTRLN